MAILNFPDEKKTITSFDEIKSFLDRCGVNIEQWRAEIPLDLNADQETILKAYEATLKPYMAKHGYQTADVISVHSETPNLAAIRQKFLREHTHTEDEVRFFVEGQGLFWFHVPGVPVFSVLCERGDLLAVPANFPHWFDLGESPFVKVIRIFTDPAGWVANYTDSGVDERYNPHY